ncbi:MAG: hypothetical protein ACREQM_04565, partial [Candidatus Dormibacteraceae bacterium]
WDFESVGWVVLAGMVVTTRVVGVGAVTDSRPISLARGGRPEPPPPLPWCTSPASPGPLATRRRQ